MYGLTTRIDLSMFTGREVEQISFSANTINIHLVGDIGITSETEVQYSIGEGAIPRVDGFPVRESGLMSFVGETIARAARTESGGLRLDFRGGGALWIEDDSTMFESFSIDTPDGHIYI